MSDAQLEPGWLARDVKRAGDRTREWEIEERLKLPLLNVCLAAVAGREGDLRDAKAFLVKSVADIVHQSTDQRGEA